MIASGVDSADQHFREILELLPAAIYTTDAEGLITYYNKAAADLWGCEPELGTSRFCGSWKLYWPDGQALPHNECPMAMTLQDEKPHHGMEAVAERPDGIRVPFIAYPTPMFDLAGNMIGAVNMLVDITDRKKYEMTQQRLVAIVDGSDDAIISKDLNGIITSWNKGAERLFGYTADEAIGQSVTILMPPEQVNEEPDILERIRRGERIDHYETVRRRKDGSILDISLTVSPLRAADGRIVGASKIARDITERKRQQEQQALLVREMRHRIKNTIGTVSSIASQTLTDISPEERSVFAARLDDLLTMDNWRQAKLSGLVQRALQPFSVTFGDRIVVDCGNFPLRPERAQTLALVLHELATNAVKYGALSNETGVVSITWTPIEGDRLAGMLKWVETGGPQVSEPERKGFGSRLIQRALGSNSKVILDYRPSGLMFSVELVQETI
ncbi:MAG: PAS domain S-box protein [Alphaproteobacteria bacterium]|nr:MAG: PAS domain S-box protein [Alphaproteobacteria bacterium]